MSTLHTQNSVTLPQCCNAGKYLAFALEPEEYGLEILKVREIIGHMKITAVPKTPDYIRGVINLRGQVIPVIDIRTLFDMEPKEITDETCIIVVEVQHDNHTFNTGVIVDRVSEVLDVKAEDIEETPQLGKKINTDFILGIGKVNDQIKILLDIDAILNGSNIREIKQNVTLLP